MIGMRQHAATFVQTWWGRALACRWLVAAPSLAHVAGGAGAQGTRNIKGIIIGLQDDITTRSGGNTRKRPGKTG
jgi:hypothetical protein